MEIEIHAQQILFGNRLSVSFQRTRQRLQQDSPHFLPKSLGAVPIHRVKHYRDRVPHEWEDDAVFLGIWPEEALWLGFAGADWKPNALKVALEEIDAVTGTGWREGLHGDPQDYIVCPPQGALDGVYLGDHLVKQFVVKNRDGGTFDSQACPDLRVVAYDPKMNRFPEHAPPKDRRPNVLHLQRTRSGSSVSLVSGAPLTQAILPDPHGIDTWDQTQSASVMVYLVGEQCYAKTTGRELSRPPGDAQGYTGYRLP
jgi:hypothetical protein